jgi:hypothetical protein
MRKIFRSKFPVAVQHPKGDRFGLGDGVFGIHAQAKLDGFAVTEAVSSAADGFSLL